MSWASDEWKDGLPQKALVKINQLESQLERLKKEKDQKQFQLESLEQTLEVQKRKGSNEKSELSELKRENQTLSETCQDLERKRLKLANDLLVKENQVTSLEQKVVKFSGHQDAGKGDSIITTGSNLSCEQIKVLEDEIKSLRQQLGEKEIEHVSINASKGKSSGDEVPKQSRHLSDVDELRKTQQDLRSLQTSVQEVELKNKKLIQDAECLRHNAEAARQHLETKMKEKEKEHNREMSQALERVKDSDRALLEFKSKCHQELNAAQAEQNKLKGLLDKAEMVKAVLEKEKQDMTKKIASAEDLLKTHNGSMAEFEKKKAVMEAEKLKLTNDLDAKDRLIQTLEAEVKKLTNSISLKEQASEALRVQKRDKEVEIEGVRAEAEKCSRKLLLAENQILDLQKQKDKVCESIKEMTNSSNKLQAAKETLEQNNVELSIKLQKVQDELSRLSASNKELQQKLSDQENCFKDSQSKWKDTENKLRQENTATEKLVDDLTDVKSKLENKINFKEGELTEMTNRCEALGKQLSGKDSELNEKTKEISLLEKQLQTISEQFETLKGKNEGQQKCYQETLGQVETALKTKTEELDQLKIKTNQEAVNNQIYLDTLLHQKKALEEELALSGSKCVKGQEVIAALESDIQVLKSDLDTKVSCISELNTALEKCQGELKVKSETNAGLSDKLNQQEQHVNELNTSLRVLEMKLGETEAELSCVGGKHQQMEIENCFLMSKIDELNEQIKCGKQLQITYQTSIEDFKTTIEHCQKDCELLQSDLQAEKEKTSALETQIESIQNRCHEFENQITLLKKDFEEKSALHKELECKCAEMSETTETDRKEKLMLQDKINSLESWRTQSESLHQQVVAEISDKLQESIKELATVKGLLESKEDIIGGLEKELRNVQDGRSDMEASLNSNRLELEQSMIQAAALGKKCSILTEELEAAQNRLSEAEKSNNVLNENMCQLKIRLHEAEELKKSSEESSDRELEKLQIQIGEYLKDLNETKSNVSELESNNSDLRAKLSDTQAKLEEMSAEHGKEAAVLKSQLEMLQMDVEDKDDCIENLKLNISNLEIQVENLSQEHKCNEEKSQSRQTELEELKRSLETFQQNLAESMQEKENLMDMNKNLEKVLLDCRASLEKNEAELKEKTSIADVSLKRLMDQEQRVQELESKNQQLIYSMNDLKDALASEKLTAHAKSSELEDMSKECARLLEDLNKTKDELFEHQNKLKCCVQSFNELEIILKKVEDEKLRVENSLSQELDKLQQLIIHKDQELSQMSSVMKEHVNNIGDLKAKLTEAQAIKAIEGIQHEQDEAALKSKLELLDMDIEDKDTMIEGLSTQLANTTSQLQNCQQEKNNLMAAVQQMETELSEVKAELIFEIEKMTSCQQEISALKDGNINLKTNLLEIQSVLQSKEATVHELESECDSYQLMIKNNENQINQLQNKGEMLTASLSEIQNALAEEKNLLVSKSSEVESLNQNCAGLSEELDNIKRQLAEKHGVTEVQKQSLNQLEVKLQLLVAEQAIAETKNLELLEQMKKQVDEKDEELIQKCSLLKDLENQTDDLKGKLAEALKQKSGGEQEHEQEAALLRAKLDMLEMDVQDKDAIIQDLNTQLENLNNQLRNLTNERGQLLSSTASMELSVSELNAELRKATENLSKAKLREDENVDRLKNLEATLAEMRACMGRKDDDLCELRTQCQTTVCGHEQITTELKVLQQEKEIMLNKLDDLQQVLSSKRDSLEANVAQLEAVTQKCAALADDLATAQTELEEKHDTITIMSDNMLQLESKLHSLEKEKISNEEAYGMELEKLKQCVMDKEHEVSSKATRVEELEGITEDLRTKLSEALKVRLEGDTHHDQETSLFKSKLDLLQMDMEDKDATIQELNTQILNLKIFIENLTKEKDDLHDALVSARTEQEKMATTFNLEIECLDKAKVDLDRSKDTVVNLEDLLNKSKMALEEKCAQLQELQLACDMSLKTIDQNEIVLKENEKEKERLLSRLNELVSALHMEEEQFQVKSSEASTLSERCATQMDELEMLKAVLNQKAETVNSQAASLEEMGKKLTAFEVQKLLEEEEKKQALDKLQEQLNSKERALHLNETHIHELENCCQDLRNKVADMTRQLSERDACLSNETAKLLSEVECLRSNLEEKDKLMKSFETQVSNLNILIDKLTAERDQVNGDFETEHVRLLEDLKEMKMELDKKITELDDITKLSDSYEQKLVQLATELESKDQQVMLLEAQIAESTKNAGELNQEVNKLSTDVLNLEACKKTLENELKCSKLDKCNLEKELFLSQDNTELKQKNLEDELETKSSELTAMQTQFDNMSQTVLKTNNKLTELQIELKAVIDQLSEVKRLYDEAKTELHDKNSTMLVLREELENAAQENDLLRGEKGDLITLEERYKHDIHELEAKIADYEVEVESTKESFESVSVQRFEALNKLRSVQREKDDLEQKMREMEAELLDMRPQIERLQLLDVQIETLNKELSRKEDTISELKVQVDDYSMKNMLYSQEVEVLNKQIRELEESLDKAETRSRHLEHQYDDLSTDTSDVMEQLTQLQEVIQTLNKSLDSKKTEIVLRINEISEKENKITELLAALEESEKLKKNLTQQVENLKNNTKQSSSTIGTLQDAIESLNFELSASEKLLKEKTSQYDFMEQELKVLKSEHETSIKQLEVTQDKLSRSEERVGSLLSKICELDHCILSLQDEVESKNTDVEKYRTSQERLQLKYEQLEMQRDILIEEHSKKLDFLEIENKKLEGKNKNYEVILSDRVLLEEKAKLSEQVLEEKSQLEKEIEELHKNITEQNKLQEHIKDLEIAKKKMEEKIKNFEVLLSDRVLLEEKAKLCEQVVEEKSQLEMEIEELHKNITEQNKLQEKIKDLEMEKKKMDEKMENYEVLLSDRVLLEEKAKLCEQVVEEKSQLEKEIEEISKNITEQNKLQEQIRALETAAKDKNELKERLEMAVAEKEALEKKLQEYQICKTVDTKENQTSILLKWEQRCSDLNNQMKMERNKVKSLTQQLEKLGKPQTIGNSEEKLSKTQTIGNSEEVETLKAELLEVKKERDYYSDEVTAMCQRAERDYKTIKEFKQQNNYMSARLKIMKSMLQVEKNKNKGIVNSSPMPQITCFNIKSDNVSNLQVIQGQAIELEAGNSVPPDSVIINESAVKPPVTEMENKNRVDISDTLVAIERSEKINPVLNSYSEINHLKSPSQRQTVNKSPSGTKRDQSISTPSLSIKKSKNSEDGSSLKTPKQSSKKSKIATPSLQCDLISKSSRGILPSTFSEEMKTKCKINTPKNGKVNDSDSSQDLLTVREKLPSSKEATGTSLVAGPNQKLSSLPYGPKTIPAITVNDKIIDTNLSTRITRRMSFQKRRSTEQSQEAVDGKKMKLSIEETIPETKPEIKPPSRRTRQQVQQISKPPSSPKKCTLPNSNVLATITNSPKKSVLPNDSSKSRVRHLRSPKHRKPPTAKGSPGGKPECNQQ